MNVENDTIIKQYKILSLLGKGGMGEVFLAQDTKLDRKVALKILPSEFAEDADRMSRFVREAKSASALNHPNIITIYEIGESDGTHFIATEFIEGETLSKHLKGENVSLKLVLDIATQIASALQTAHSAGIVHRDIKPDNVMIRADGLAKILDFGIAKLSVASASAEVSSEDATTIKLQSTSPGMIIGTANYMSPEQARGKDVDHQTDIFSFGVVFYELVSGNSPFSGETVSDVIAAVLTKEPKKLGDIPIELEEILSKTLEKVKKNRYQTAKDLLIDLQEAKEELSVQSRLERTSSPNLSEPKTQILHAATTAETDSQKSIAVLSFTNMSADEENEYFCEGLAEELLNSLSKIEDLKVAARTSAFSFKGKNAKVSEIGETLGVKNVLEGSVRKSGSKLRISVQLVNASDGFHLWSERYDREMVDIFDVQDEIALAVVDALKLKLFGDEKAELLKRGTDNSEAYQFYLKGRYFWNNRSGENLRKAIEQFKAAADIDPNYALAFVGLADCYVLLPYYTTATSTEVLHHAETYINLALEINDSLGEAHTTLGFINLQSWDWAESEKSFERAIDLNPNYATTHRNFANYLLSVGRHDEAEIELKRAVELEPLSLINYHMLALTFSQKGDLKNAVEQCQRAIELDLNWYYLRFDLALFYIKQGRNAEAITEVQKSVELSKRQTLPLGILGYVYAKAGRQTDAINIIEELSELYQKQQSGGLDIAHVYAGLGEKDQAFVWLDKEFQSRNQLMPLLFGLGLFDALHDDPRFKDLLKRMGLPTAKTNRTDESLEAKTVMLSTGEVTSETPAKDLQTENAETKLTTNRKSEIRNPKSKWWLFGLLTLVLAVGGFFGYKYLSPAKQIESIAVLPFENKSSDADSDYLSDGLAESLIYRLSQIPDLKVSPTSSVFRYKGKATDPQVVAKELGVDSVLTGRITQRGDNLNISVNLVDTQNSKSLRGEQYERKMSELLLTQKEIAAEITNNLKLKLSGESEQKLAKRYTDNNEAYQLYLKGRYHYAKRTKEDILKGIENFEQAIALDPNFALAYVELSDSYATMPAYPYLSPKEAFPKAKAAARKALEIDPTLAEAHTALGFSLAVYDWNWAEAKREFEKALELNPNLSFAHFRYGWNYLSPLGRSDEAITEMKRALELEPMALVTSFSLAIIYADARQNEQALAQARKIYDLEPNFPTGRWAMSQAFIVNRMYSDAIELNEKSLQTAPTNQLFLRFAGCAYGKSNRRKEAEAIINKFGELSKTEYVMSYRVANIYAALGEKDKAFAELERAFENHDWELFRLKADPLMDSLRDDPRYKDLLKRMGLPE